MAQGSWSTGCRADVEYFGYPGLGAYYRSRFGQHWVGGGVYQKFASVGFECYVNPFLGAPVKPFGWIAEMNYGKGCQGQWFENGAIGYHDGAWRVMFGRYGQSALKVALRHPVRRLRQHPSASVTPPDAPMIGSPFGPPSH